MNGPLHQGVRDCDKVVQSRPVGLVGFMMSALPKAATKVWRAPLSSCVEITSPMDGWMARGENRMMYKVQLLVHLVGFLLKISFKT